MSIAFAPAKGYGPENTGVIALGDSTFNVRQALEEGDGVIVVPDHDTLTIARLDDHPVLKRVPVPKEPETVVDRYEGMTVPELREEARSMGVENPGRSREEVLAAVRGAVEASDE